MLLGLFRDNGKENGNYHLGFRGRIWGIWSYNIPTAIFYLLKGDYIPTSTQIVISLGMGKVLK